MVERPPSFPDGSESTEVDVSCAVAISSGAAGAERESVVAKRNFEAIQPTAEAESTSMRLASVMRLAAGNFMPEGFAPQDEFAMPSPFAGSSPVNFSGGITSLWTGSPPTMCFSMISSTSSMVTRPYHVPSG